MFGFVELFDAVQEGPFGKINCYKESMRMVSAQSVNTEIKLLNLSLFFIFHSFFATKNSDSLFFLNAQIEIAIGQRPNGLQKYDAKKEPYINLT